MWFPSRRQDGQRSTFSFQVDGLVGAQPRWDLCGKKKKKGLQPSRPPVHCSLFIVLSSLALYAAGEMFLRRGDQPGLSPTSRIRARHG